MLESEDIGVSPITFTIAIALTSASTPPQLPQPRGPNKIPRPRCPAINPPLIPVALHAIAKEPEAGLRIHEREICMQYSPPSTLDTRGTIQNCPAIAEFGVPFFFDEGAGT